MEHSGEDEMKKLEQLGIRGFRLLQDLLADRYSYMTPLIFALRGEPDWLEETMGTDGRTVFYNPGYVVEQLGGRKSGYEKLEKCYLQMVAHCLLGHIWMKEAKDRELWDCSCDMEAEFLVQDIVQGKQTFENRWDVEYVLSKLRKLDAGNLFSLTGEKACQRIIRENGKLAKRDDHDKWKEKKMGFDQNGNQGIAGGSGQEGFPNFAAGSGQDDGSAFQMWQELWKMAFGMFPEDVRGRIIAGLLPGSALEVITASEENESDYKSLLRKYCTMKEKRVEDFESLDCAWYSLGMEMYGNIPLIEYPESSEQPDLDDIVIAIDVSGSCLGDTACRFLRETCNMIRDLGIGWEPVNIRIMECDAAIVRETVIRSKDDIPDFEQREMRGFGGTSFVPVFDRIDELLDAKEVREVRCLLYLSDGMGDFPEKEPEYDVIFVLNSRLEGMNDEMTGRWVPDWVTRVYLTEKDLEGEQIV